MVEAALMAADSARVGAGPSSGGGNGAAAAASEQEGLEQLYMRIVRGQVVGHQLSDRELELVRQMEMRFGRMEQAWLEGASRMRDLATLMAKVQCAGVMEAEEQSRLGAALLILRTEGGAPAGGAGAAAVAQGMGRTC